ncbi:MAG: hypothetical protein HYY84_14650 [Deltaproteobacteria bacterium]|nr:hypothetical protein [Deltaproteobacteria bacterium]
MRTTIHDLLSADVHDGDLVGIGGTTLEMNPMALVRALIDVLREANARVRLVVAPIGGVAVEALIGAGVVSEIECAQVSLGDFGSAPAFRRAIESGATRIRESSCPALLAALHAGASGLPSGAVRAFKDSQILDVRRDYKSFNDPVSGETLVAVPAIRPDVALIHGFAADAAGNVVLDGETDDLVLARAAQKVVATVEELVPSIAMLPGQVLFSSIYATKVFPGSRGAAPTAVRGLYPASRPAGVKS